MAPNSRNTMSPPFNAQSKTARTTISSPAVWPPATPRPGEQFRLYLSGIDFYNDQGADDMFANPTPVPGFEIYPQPDAMFARPATPVPDFKGDEDHEKPRSTPLAPLLPEDFPPARGTGLGKTTVLIRKRPRVADEAHIGIGSAAIARPGPSETLRPAPRGVETLSAAIEKRVNASTPSIDAAGVAVKVTSDMGPPPPRPWHRRVESVSAGGQTINGRPSSSGPSPERQRLPQSLPQCKHLPVSDIRDFAFTTGGETGVNGQSSSMDAPLRHSSHGVKTPAATFAERLDEIGNLQAILVRARARRLGCSTINGSPSDVGPSPKRQRLSQSFHQKKPLPGSEGAAKPAKVASQRYGGIAPRNSVPTGRPTINAVPPETDLLSESFPEWERFLHRGHGFVLADQWRKEARNRTQIEHQRTEVEDERLAREHGLLGRRGS
jgi:hypothetical protein